jgi:hypothetical protein
VYKDQEKESIMYETRVSLHEVIETNKGSDLPSRIEQLAQDLNRRYTESLREGTSLKDKIDSIEKHLGEKEKDRELERKEDLAVEELDALVDNLVLMSGKLNDLRESCKKVQDLTTSLLCYSLSRFRDSKKDEKKE